MLLSIYKLYLILKIIVGFSIVVLDESPTEFEHGGIFRMAFL